MRGIRRFKIKVNAPVTISFLFLCVATQILSEITGGDSNRALFTVYRSSFVSPITYLRCFLHVFGHSGWSHLFSNALYLLILGPMLEEKYGARGMIRVILITAFVTGLTSILLFPHTALLGASSVVFSMILLSSVTRAADGSIPLTFVLVAAVYLGRQVYDGIFTADNISQTAHIVGGLVGAGFGFAWEKRKKYAKR